MNRQFGKVQFNNIERFVTIVGGISHNDPELNLDIETYVYIDFWCSFNMPDRNADNAFDYNGWFELDACQIRMKGKEGEKDLLIWSSHGTDERDYLTDIEGNNFYVEEETILDGDGYPINLENVLREYLNDEGHYNLARLIP